LIEQAASAVVTDEDILSAEELRRDAFYNQSCPCYPAKATFCRVLTSKELLQSALLTTLE
jgi:hypothetical protein